MTDETRSASDQDNAPLEDEILDASEALGPVDEDEPEDEIYLNEDCTFSDLMQGGEILSAIEKLGFTKPTEVQRKGMPYALKGLDTIMQAQTGSGKTLAYVVPLLEQLKAASSSKEISQPFALVVVPTRELALQVKEVIASLTTTVEPVCVIGGVDVQQQIRELHKDNRVVVGTPGRLLDLIKQKELRLHQCRFFVLDEVDEMLSIGFIEDVRSILSRLPDRRQGLFVSATITPRVEMLAHSFLSHPKTVLIEDAAENKPAIEHLYFEIGGDLMAKPSALCDLIETARPRSAIIFCNTKSDTQLVEALLRRRGFDARRINSDLTQAQRDRVMKKIRAQELQFLVATDIAARGIDIEQIELVINYSIHEQPEAYVHRTGRTGRAGRRGKAVSLVGPRDFGAFHFLTKVLDIKFQKLPLPTDAEVADARLTHLYEMIRQKEIELKDRDVLVARQLLREIGGITEPVEDLEAIVAKLCRYTVEHYVFHEAKSLDEELDAPPRPAQSSEGERGEGRRRDRDSRGRGRDRDSRDRDRDRGGREGREERRGRRRDDERGGRDRGPRDEGAGEERPGRRDYSAEASDGEQLPENSQLGEQAGGRSEERSHERSPRGREGSGEGGREHRRDDDRGDNRRGPAGNVRVYIGQGTAHGMTPQLFADLALEVGEIDRKNIKRVALREHYGFVDLPAEPANKLIGNLNGIEYNGHPLPVELAIVPTSRPRSGQDRDRRRGDSERGRGGDRGGRDRDRRGRGGRDSRGGGGSSRGRSRDRRNSDY